MERGGRHPRGGGGTCRADHLELPPSATIGTSSLRRAAQVLAVAPGVRILALRGNVPTRIRKLRDGGYDAILLAAAGVWGTAVYLSGTGLTPGVTASIVSLAAGALAANVLSVIMLLVETVMFRR